MGQYYYILTKKENGKRFTRYDRSVDGEYVSAKLMEHSWWENETLGGICELIHHTPTRVWWVGDYANTAGKYGVLANGMTDEEAQYIWKKAWCGKNKYRGLSSSKQVSLDDKFLVNHTKKEYLDGTKYFLKSVDANGWCVHPLSLLTAVGNGLGGGDYCGLNKEEVGSWAGDVISVENEAPTGYTENIVSFMTRYIY